MQKYKGFIRFLSLIFLLALSQSGYAQLLQWGNPVKMRGTAIFTQVLGENEAGVFTMRYRNRFYSKGVILQRYDHYLSLLQIKSVDLKNSRLIRAELTPKGLLLIHVTFNRKKQVNKVYAQWYSHDLKPQGKPRFLAESKVQEYGDRGTFRMTVSDDKRWLALIHTTKGDDKNVVLHQQRFNSELVLKDSSSKAIPYPYSAFVLRDFMIGNNGEITMLCKTIQRSRKKTATGAVVLYRLNEEGWSDHAIPDSIQVKNLYMTYERSTDKPKVLCLYGEHDNYGIEGVMVIDAVNDEQDWQLRYHVFSDSFINEISVAGLNTEVIPEGFDFLSVIPRSDGGLLMILEQKEIATEDDIIMVNGIPQSTSKNIYNFNEILVLNFDADLELDWHELIVKNQTTVNDGGYYSSATVFVGERFVQLFYNDQLRNSGDVIQYTLLNNGVVESSNLLKAELDYVAIIPSEARQVSSNKLIIPTLKNRRFALLKIIYQ